MNAFQAAVLGAIQAITEFLPISSSAHLNIFPWIFGWDVPEAFDVALHIGTLLAMVIFFFKDWVKLFKGGFKRLFKKEKSAEGKIFWYLVIATIPAGILSLILDKLSSRIVAGRILLEMGLIAIALIVMGIILYIVDKRSKSDVEYKDITLKQSVLIGISQSLAAAFPGVSRSGITMTVARGLKIDRQSAAKFSFLLATPITLAAILVDLNKFTFSIPFLIGVLVSFILGMVVIKFLLQYLQKGSFKGFAIYRVLLGIVIFVLILTRI